MNGDSGQDRRAASSRCSVPSAFTSKSRNGMAAARSCEGCAAVWMMRFGLQLLDQREQRVAVPDVERCMAIAGDLPPQTLQHPGLVSPSGPKKTARWLLSIPATSKSLLCKEDRDFGANQATRCGN